MNTTSRLFAAVMVCLLLILSRANATVFTSNTFISPLDTSYDGTDIVVSNCVVNVDGAHSFNSLLITNGGVMTHTPLTNGSGTLYLSVTNELEILNGTNAVTLLHSNVSGDIIITDTSSTIIYTNGADYVQYSPGNGTTQIYRTETSSIPDGATVFASYTWTYTYNSGLYLNLASDLAVASSGSINANAAGFSPGLGTGRGFSSIGSTAEGTGASHAGSGGSASNGGSVSACYGSLYQPATLGSGGGTSYAGSGGAGGGRIQITAGGSVIVDGVISVNGANATNSRSGGGSGGSIWITATNFSGLGSLTANGGSGEPVHGGGAGGGRISIQCATNNFTGTLSAIGGTGWYSGGAGTIFTQTNDPVGLLVLDNGGRNGNGSTISLPTMADVTIRNGAAVVPGSFNPRNVTIGTNAALGSGSFALLTLNIAGDLQIQSGGRLIVDEAGSFPGFGSAPGISSSINSYYPSGGGGYGGIGAAGADANARGGSTYYGSITAPTSLGSGGGNGASSIGGYGGGAVQLNVTGALLVDGKISANGGNGSGTGGGGGSGGSIYIANCALFTGSGSLTANGGNGVTNIGGGGGGGRIAVVASSNSFSGTITALGGSGAGYAGAGTIYTQVGSSRQLIIDNGGNAGTNTTINSLSTTALIIRNGAKVVSQNSSSLSFVSLLINSNGWLTHVPASSMFLSISGDATIQAGGGFLGNLLGRTGGQGSGAGSSYSTTGNPGGGGGYGGRGGNSYYFAATGGAPGNDSAANPSLVYSGSGGGSSSTGGGSGGGFFQLTVGGTLQLDGVINANGGNGSSTGGGGGAGGGVVLNVGTLAGNGSVSVNGGAGVAAVGGGGGGGRIAVYLNNNNFTGSLTAFGGSGYAYGGAGTIYLKTNSVLRGQVIVDNGGRNGADTVWTSSSVTDLILRNGGASIISGNSSFGNLTISSNSVLIFSNSTTAIAATINAASVTVQPGGLISADGTGSTTGSGVGNNIGAIAPFYACSGAGHGGYGAQGATSTIYPAGITYDSVTSPTSAGSAGGGFSSASFGGRGGGALNFSLVGNFQLDGILSANGGSGFGTGGGGGSGGSININCDQFTGTGSITANGGAGAGIIGGGGGGGMIAINFSTNLFSGTISSVGGGGGNIAGAGTLYLRNTSSGQSQLIVDNGSRRGANTPIVAGGDLIVRNGAVAVTTTPAQLTYSSLWIGSNALVSPNSVTAQTTVNLLVTGDTTIQSGGSIFTDSLGSAQNTGSGRGFSTGSPNYQGSGGGHGGNGAIGLTNSTTPAGGITYDSTASPSVVGSGGGGTGSQSIGGSGGGYVRLLVNGALQLDGSITANGGSGNYGGGGGSGGSIYLAPGILTGSGNISANGGNGSTNIGGGGGGGRIAVYFNTNNFTGNITAFGGSGYAYGGAGTIYLKTNSQPFGMVLLDNNNNAGTNTTFDYANLDMTIQNQAVGSLPTSGSWSAHNILIRTNSRLAAPASALLRTLLANNLTIDSGGSLSFDGAGNSPQLGTGAGYGSGSPRGGGGHGGYGGGNPVNFGRAYGSIQSPTSAGSGGGSVSSPFAAGGAGGGALALNVTGTLTVNGKLSANGRPGDYNAGGGSGGSLNLQNISQLSGNGLISANGGSSTGSAGAGGGGRIAIVCNSNNFNGQISANGGNGLFPGGAGTIYTRINNLKTLTVDNGGLSGTNTPLDAVSFSMPSAPFNLNISGAAVVVPVGSLPLVSNLNLAAGAFLTMPAICSNLVIAVSHDANLAGSINLNNLGYAQTNGPGAGTNIASQGSGGGYGGAGGNSASGATGGIIYGSAAQPVDFGSGGGAGSGTLTGGSGGGAVRISVGGTLTIDGNLSANGGLGQQDNSGGGSGGSVWISANSIAGLGTISATGGDGDLWNGGGGGGGRIAIYSPTNIFAGITNLAGGIGWINGQSGTLFLSSTPMDFFVNSQSPTGTVTNTVSYVDLTFNEAVDPASVSAAAFTLNTPAGVVPSANLAATTLNSAPATVRVSFPVQNLLGDYSLQVAPSLTNILGRPLAAGYTGNFTIFLPTISGNVHDTNGAPVAGVTVQPDGGLIGATTDTNGNYSVGIPSGWSGNLTPSLGTNAFVPGILNFVGIAGSLTNQNFLLVPTIAPSLTTGLGGTNFSLSWQGISGVNYQAWSSTNLTDWATYGAVIPGTNGTILLVLPTDGSPSVFFKVSAAN